MFKGITKRWFLNTFAVIVLIFTIIALSVCKVLHDYYYNGVENGLKAQSNTSVTDYFSLYSDSSTKFQTGAREFIQSFAAKDKMEVRIINKYGRVIISSLGFSVGSDSTMPDYESALNSPDGTGLWIGKQSTNENVMAYTMLLQSPEENSPVSGAVRFSVSLKNIDTRLRQSYAIVIGISLLVIGISLLSSLYFIRSIVRPIRDIESKTALIARGDFDVRISKKYDDEVGELSDSINNMAIELGKIEKMKNDFISTVSHELRTPLTAIKGWAETISDMGTENAELTRRGMEVISEETTRLSHMVEELLGFSKIQSDRFKMVFQKTDLLAELADAYYMFKERARRENKELLYTAPSITALAMADSNRIKQVFVNVLDNAIKYTPEGGRITVVAELYEKVLTVTIKDSGKGISKEDLPHIMDKFYKGANSISGSSGIGLAVANEIIKQHNGIIKIDSILEIGTTVRITLPLANESVVETREENTNGK